jgi:hydrogenase maturation protein HypF
LILKDHTLRIANHESRIKPMNHARVKIIARGAVQAVGFRPFVYRLATGMSLAGWVMNSAQGVFIEAEGAKDALDQFLLRLAKEKPQRAAVQSLEFSFLDPVGYQGFEIRDSDESGKKTVLIMPDMATCSDCLREIFDPNDRRYLYPFTNCTNCGPRFSIIESLPYDRANSSMKNFTMCPACQKEYDDPRDRRFHAQPNACPDCGPRLELWDNKGNVLLRHHEALLQAAAVIRAGKILALKGIGGFQLLVDARNHAAVLRLRARKQREEKPFALMYPSLALVAMDCRVSELEARLLQSPESPIVLLERKSYTMNPQPPYENSPATSHKPRSTIHHPPLSIAPGNPYLGVMLPYSPLHHLLMRALEFPIVATSGNLSDEPICIDEREALSRLGVIADAFLVHNRPIVRHVDDSVAGIVLGRELLLRRARGYAPLPIHLKASLPGILASGAHLKNAVALGVDTQIFVSQHIGDLETNEAYAAFRRVLGDFQKLYDATPELVVCDMHPDYLSTKHARELGIPVMAVQHHYAHVAACMAENEVEPPVLGVSWDGTGLGLDGTIWGGEFLLVDEASFQRVAHIHPFRLPGGKAAIKEPRRTALGVLYEIFGEEAFTRTNLFPLQAFSVKELSLVRRMLEKGVNAPVTSSVGRLFDAVAAIAGLRQRNSFEGQAAMELEFAIGGDRTEEVYPFRIAEGTARPSTIVLDWKPMILEILTDLQNETPLGTRAAKFHNTLAEMIVAVAKLIGEEKVALTGGCFQNRYLTARTVHRLESEGFRPYWHQRVPPNDGGIALGQVFAAARTRRVRDSVRAISGA